MPELQASVTQASVRVVLQPLRNRPGPRLNLPGKGDTYSIPPSPSSTSFAPGLGQET